MSQTVRQTFFFELHTRALWIWIRMLYVKWRTLMYSSCLTLSSKSWVDDSVWWQCHCKPLWRMGLRQRHHHLQVIYPPQVQSRSHSHSSLLSLHSSHSHSSILRLHSSHSSILSLSDVRVAVVHHEENLKYEPVASCWLMCCIFRISEYLRIISKISDFWKLKPEQDHAGSSL